MEKKLISFDIWDTIIKRKCHPEEIKLHTAKYIFLKYNMELKKEYIDIYNILKKRDEIEAEICEKNQHNGFDAECKIEDVFSRLIAEIFKNDAENKANVQELLNVEMKQEKEMIYINKDILPILEQYKELRKCLISDFYMSSKQLEELINYLQLPVKFEKIYSSADYLLNKKTGNLYKKAEEELKIKPEEHIHVGDNEYSDIESAKAMGISTIKVKRDNIDFKCKRERKIEFDYSKAKKEDSNIENRLFNLGLELSPLLYFFGYSVVEYAIKNKEPIIYYFTREGERFIKAYDLIKKDNPFTLELPKAEILEVSRMATFAASLKEFSISELLRLWSQYRTQSMVALFKTLAIDIEPYKKYMEKYGFDIKQDISELWFDLRMQKLCKDEEFLKQINSELKEKRKNLIDYFKNKGIMNEKGKMFIVDIGWRGTIQDNIAYIFDKKQIDGYYITLYDYYNLQPPNTKKIKFIKNRQIILEYISSIITVLEMIFSSNSGSVIEYKNGKAIRKAKDEEIQAVQNYIEHIQNGMLKGSDIINEQMKIHPYEAEEFDKYIENLIKNIKENPSKDLVDIYYNLVMNDTFGTGKYVNKKNQKLNILQRVNIIKCRNKLRTEMWKEAYIKYNHLEYINCLINIKSVIKKIIRIEK